MKFRVSRPTVCNTAADRARPIADANSDADALVYQCQCQYEVYSAPLPKEHGCTGSASTFIRSAEYCSTVFICAWRLRYSILQNHYKSVSATVQAAKTAARTQLCLLTCLLTLEVCSHNATLHDRCWSIEHQSSVHKPEGLTGCAPSSTSGLHAPRCRYIIHVFRAAGAELNSSPRRRQDDPTAKHVVHIIYNQPVASPSPTHSFIRAECGHSLASFKARRDSLETAVDSN